MKSKTALFRDMGEIGYTEIAENKLDSQKISNETFGKDSHIFIWLDTKPEADTVKRKLTARGHLITSYGIDTAISVRVTYFKGWHWDE